MNPYEQRQRRDTRNVPADDPWEADRPDIRPLVTRHRLRKRRRRAAATLLTGASLAFGLAAVRIPSAAAQGGLAREPVVTPAIRSGDGGMGRADSEACGA